MTKDTKRQSEILDGLYSAIKIFNQGAIFGPLNNEKIINLCVDYLRFSGYTVKAPDGKSVTIKSLDELISEFYTRLNNKRGNKAEVYMVRHKQGRDRSIASAFVKSRMELTGNSFENALQESALIVKTVIDYEEEFHFKYELTSFSVFGQKNLKWVTERAVDIINRKLDKHVEERKEVLVDKVIASQDVSNLGYSDLDILVQQLEEGGNGKG